MLQYTKWIAVAALAVAVPPAFAQQTQAPVTEGGWRKFGDGDSSLSSTPPSDAPDEQVRARAPHMQNRNVAPPAFQSAQVPGRITIPAGTWITVRVDQPLSSDHNRAGDAFTATLTAPVVADGIVVARRGQTLAGRVAESMKAGRIKGTSSLGVEMIELSIVDGQRVPVRTELMQYAGGTSVGRDVTAVGTTTGIGAAIGASAAGGFGAGMGAIAGAGASAIGVLVTRGRATEIFPEAAITFRLTAPVEISTERGQQAFHPVRQEDYEARQLQQRTVHVSAPSPYYSSFGYGSGYGYGYEYPYFYSPYRSFGPSFYYSSGPRYYGGRGGGGRRR